LKAIRSPGCPATVLERFARAAISGDEEPKISWRAACLVASHPSCPPEAFGLLLSHDRRSVRDAVLTNPGVPLQVLQDALMASLVHPYRVARHPAVDRQACIHLASCDHDGLQKTAAYSTNCPPEILTQLAQHDDRGTPYQQRTRWVVAGNPNTPHPVLMQLAGDRATYMGLLDNPALDGEILREMEHTNFASLAAHGRCVNWVHRRILANPHCPPDLLIKTLQEDTGAHCLAGVASNPNCPQDMLQQLLRHPIASVRICAARNPSVPAEWLIQRAQDSSVNVRMEVAASTTCPPDTLVQLLGDKHPGVRERAMCNPNLPEEYKALRQLAG